MIKGGATHIAVATDHVIESFRNGLWPGYKTSEGIEPDLLAQFPLLEEVLSTAGIVVWRTEECAEQAIFSRRRPVSTARRAVAGQRVGLNFHNKGVGGECTAAGYSGRKSVLPRISEIEPSL
jgi:hypothetical protein